MSFVDEKMSINCTSWWGPSLARDESRLRLRHTKEQPFIIYTHKLQVSAFELQTVINVLSPTNNNHVRRYFQRLLRFLLTYLFATLKVSICNVSLCSRDIQMLLPVHTPNQTDWPQSYSHLGRLLLRDIPHLPLLRCFILNYSDNPPKCSDFSRDWASVSWIKTRRTEFLPCRIILLITIPT